MNFKDLTFDELKTIKLCVALHVDKNGDATFPDLLIKLRRYVIAYQTGLDFGKKYIDTLNQVIRNEENKT
jgi:hypothetical protein